MEGKEQIIKILNEELCDERQLSAAAIRIIKEKFPAIAEKLSQLDGWVKVEDEQIKEKWKTCKNCDCGEFPKSICDCSCHD